MQRGRLHLLLIPLAALIPVLPLLLNGCSCGHDFDFHLLNWLEAARQFAHDNLHPQWAFTPAFNAGEPRFIFYPPLSWTLGAILGLIFPWAATPIIYTWLVLTAAGLSLHRLARSFASPTAALLVSVFYLVNPYTLFTAYERTAYAELLAAVWIPLLLHAILTIDDLNSLNIIRLALPIALLWITNAPAAVISCYALALLTVIRLATHVGAPSSYMGAPSSPRSLRLRWVTTLAHPQGNTTARIKLALTALMGTALGLGLASFYIVPAAWQRRYVQINMAILPGLRVQDNFLFHHTATGIIDPAALADATLHDSVLHTASLIAVLLLALTAIILIYLYASSTPAKDADAPSSKDQGAQYKGPGAPSSPRSLRLRWASRDPGSPANALVRRSGDSATAPREILLSLTLLTAFIAFLLTPLSAPIWSHLPELRFLQFPWRILAILAPVLTLTLAIAFSRIRLNSTLTAALSLALAAALTWPAYTLFHQPCDPADTVTARVALFHSSLGSDPTDEYTPIAADNDALGHTNPPYWLASNPTTPASSNATPGPAPFALTLSSPLPQFLILNLRYYPAWRITLDGSPIITRAPRPNPRPDGLIAIPIPGGPAQLRIAWITQPDSILGALLSLIALTILSLMLLRTRALKV